MRPRLFPVTVFLLSFLVTLSATAAVELSFPGWDKLTQGSPDIIVARCTQTPDLFKDHGSGPTGSLFNSDITVVSLLKSSTNWAAESKPRSGPAHLVSEYIPRQGEYYLIFSIFYDGEFQATEEYRVIPLGLNYNPDFIANDPLDKQVRTLLKCGLENLNRQIDKDEEQKARLQEASQQ